MPERHQRVVGAERARRRAGSRPSAARRGTRPRRAMKWSAGSTIITSSSGRSTATVASAIAAAVLRPAGSISDPDVRELGAHQLLVPLVGDDRDVDRDAVPVDAGEPPHRRLEEALVAEQRHERLGALRARQRPQAGAAPARHHDHVHRAILGSARRRRASAARGALQPGEGQSSGAARPSAVATANRTNLATPAALASRTSNRRARGRVDAVRAASYHPRTGRGRGGRSARVEERV